MSRRSLPLVSVSVLAVALVAGCRGGVSSDPPVHLLGDMDWQPKFGAQDRNPMFADERSMRPLVAGTVPHGSLDETDPLLTGKQDGTFLAYAPVEVDAPVIRRGQERFNIYCAPCHDQSGSGQGMIVKRGYPPPVDLASDRVRGMADGEIFEVITHGVRNMPSYRKQIPPKDRWAIVAWVRALQHSQHARLDDVPDGQRGNIAKESGSP